jgi:hypothetical protein
MNKVPDVNLWMALLTFTDVELMPPQSPLSEVMITMTFFLTSTPVESKQTGWTYAEIFN